MGKETSAEEGQEPERVGRMLASSGYSDKAIRYFLDKPYMGEIPDAEQVSELTGSCGDTMRISLQVEGGVIRDARYQVLGCPGAIAAAMAVVDLIKGKRVEEARRLKDGEVFRLLEAIPAQKNHCIELAVKTLLKALQEYGQKTNPEP